MQRKRTKHVLTFKERLKVEAIRFREAAEMEAQGSKARELLMRRARQADIAADMNDWLNSPGLASPK